MKSKQIFPLCLGIEAFNSTRHLSVENDIRPGNFSTHNIERNTKWNEFSRKYEWNLEMGRTNCPTTTDFNSETDDPMHYSGFYLGDEGVGSNTVDFAKVLRV